MCDALQIRAANNFKLRLVPVALGGAVGCGLAEECSSEGATLHLLPTLALVLGEV